MEATMDDSQTSHGELIMKSIGLRDQLGVAMQINSLPGPIRAEGKQVMALGWAPKAADTIKQCTIQHQEKTCFVFSVFYPLALFISLVLLPSTSVHSPLIPLMFLPLPFFAPSPP